MKMILVGCLFLVSCATLRKAKPVDNQIPLTKENIPQINGEYEIFSRTDTKSSLDQSLLFNEYWWNDRENRHKYTLTLKTIKKKQLQVDVYKSGNLVKSKKIRYKIKNGALLFNRIKFKTYLVITACGAMHTRLRVNTAGELIIDHSHSTMGGFIIIPTAGENIKDEGAVFQKRR